MGTEIEHTKKMDVDVAIGRYQLWLETCNWSLQPSFAFWWAASELGVSNNDDYKVWMERIDEHIAAHRQERESIGR